MDTESIARYCEDMRRGDIFPPIVVFNDGAVNWIGDGNHRIFAAISAGMTDIEAEIRPGTRDDALKYALTANDTHGIRATNADKRHGVEMALDNEAWKGLSNCALADLCGVSEGFVRKIKKERDSYSTNIEDLTDTDGAEWDTRLLLGLKKGDTLEGSSLKTMVIQDEEGNKLQVNAAHVFIRQSNSTNDKVPDFKHYDYGVLLHDSDGEQFVIDGMGAQGSCGIERRMTTIYEYEYGPLRWRIEPFDTYGAIIDTVYGGVAPEEREREAMLHEIMMMKKHGHLVRIDPASPLVKEVIS
jgi:hypothetical protein